MGLEPADRILAMPTRVDRDISRIVRTQRFNRITTPIDSLEQVEIGDGQRHGLTLGNGAAGDHAKQGVGSPRPSGSSRPIHPGSEIASACTVSSLGQSPHHPLIQTLSTGSRTEGQTLMQLGIHSHQKLAAVLP